MEVLIIVHHGLLSKLLATCLNKNEMMHSAGSLFPHFQNDTEECFLLEKTIFCIVKISIQKVHHPDKSQMFFVVVWPTHTISVN